MHQMTTMRPYDALPTKNDRSPAILRNRAWAFLNSAFGLWVLSTLAVGGLTTLYTSCNNRRVEKQARKERIEKLDLEIEGRLSQFLVNVERMVAKPCDGRFSLSKGFTNADIQRCWRALKMPPSTNPEMMTAVFPENAQRGIVSLVVELSRLVDEEASHAEKVTNTLRNKQGKIVKEWATTKDGDEIRDAAVSIVEDSVFDGPATDDFLPVWEHLRKSILLARWTLSFPYVDCPTKPFC